MPIMSRVEPLNTWFFPISALWVDGKITTAPKEAVKTYCELKNESWYLAKREEDCPEIPMVSLYPGKEDGKDGYFVRAEIMYK